MRGCFMRILYIDTTSSYLYSAIMDDNKIVSEVKEKLEHELSEKALPKIVEMFNNEKLDPKSIEKIIVVNGPGSFTGVRTGVTVAKTLSYLLNVSIKQVSYLDIMDFSLDTNENLVGFYDNSGIFVGKYLNHRLTGKYEYIKKRELNLNEFSNLKTDVIIDYSKIYNLISKLPKIDPKQVNPIYVKKISVEYD